MRIAVVAAAVCLSVVGLSQADDAKAAMRLETHIPAESLGVALKSFAQDRNLQILYFSDAVRDLHTGGAVGQLTTDEALTQLLSGTGLTYRYVGDKAITILPASSTAGGSRAPGSPSSSPPTTSADQKEGKTDSSGAFLLAQAAQGPTSGNTSVESRQKRAGTAGSEIPLQEVIVTAQKRAERLIDVPISIVAVDADELKRRQLTTLDDLQAVVPDLSVSYVGNSRLIQLRGISNITGTASSVGMYFDEADVTLGGTDLMQINPVLFDLDRVEVLRGPQGTLYGEGSAGGTIRFITRNPNLNNFTFDSDVAALFTQGGGPSQRINAAASIPLIQSQLGLRIASTIEHDGGWIDQPAANSKDINWQDLTNVRVKGLWQPSPKFSVSAMAILNRNDRGPDWSDTSTPHSWTQAFDFTTTPRAANDYDLYNLTITYDFSSLARLLNTISYLRESAPLWNQGASYQETPPGTPMYEYYSPYENIDDHLLTDELRLTSIGSGRWQWTIGGLYRHYRDFVDLPVNYFALSGPPGTPLPAPYASTLDTLYKSSSVFGDTSYRLSDRLTLGAGARYFQESQDYTLVFFGLTEQAARFHSLDPRVYAQFKLTPSANVYASAAKGFRSGGFNSVGQPTFGPENVWTYELGTKIELADGQVDINTAAFWSDYSDYQATGMVAGSIVGYISNAGRARIKGLESDLTWRLSSQWRLDVRGDYLNGRFTELNATSTAYAVGDPIDLVPRYQFTLSGQYDFSWRARPCFIRLDYSQQGPQTYRDRSVGPWFFAESDVIHMLNLRTSVLLTDNLRVGLVAQNVLNDQGFASPFFSYEDHGERPRPRTFGIDFSVTFD